METALATPENNNLLALARSQVARPRLPDYPTIRMRNAKSSMKDIEKGAYAVVRKIEANGAFEEQIVSLDSPVQMVVLKRRYSYSFYDEDQDKLVAWTNELDGFTQNQVVKLCQKIDTGKSVRTFTWPEFKTWKLNDPLGQKLSFKNILYVCIGEQKVENLARLFVSNASVTGVVDGQKTGDYKHPLPGSFLEFEKPFSYSGAAYLESVCELGSKWLDQNEYYLMTFANAGANAHINESLSVFKLLLADLQMRYEQDFGADVQARTDIDGNVPDVEVIMHEPSIRAEDLPF